MKFLSPRSRRWWILGAVVLGAAGGGWYVHHRQVEQELAERSMKDIPKAEYEAWMQSLGYTN